MASNVDSKQNEATCSNKTKPKYKPVNEKNEMQNETTQLYKALDIFYYFHKAASLSALVKLT